MIIGILIVFIAVATLLTVLLGTEPGARWIVKQAAGLAPGTLTVERVRGTLLQGLELEGIDFEDEDENVNARLESLAVRVNAAALFAARLSVTRLDAHGLNLRIRPDPDPAPTEPFRLPDTVALPIAVDLAPARFTDLSVQIGDAEPVLIHEIRLAAEADRDAARISTLVIDAPDFHVDLTARAGLAAPFPLNAELHWRVRLPEPLSSGFQAPEGRGQLSLEGDLDRLALEHRVNAPLQLSGSGVLRDLPRDLRWDLVHRWQAFNWHQPDFGIVAMDSGELHSEGTLDEFTLALDTGVTLPDVPSQHIKLTATGNTEAFSSFTLGLTGDSGRLAVQGSAGWLPEPVWDVTVSGRDLDPGVFNPDVPGRLDLDAQVAGRVDASGTPDVRVDALTLTGSLLDEDIRLEGSARLSDTQLTTPGVTLSTPEGTLTAQGVAGWDPQPHWDLRVQGQDLDPGRWLADWPGRLDLALDSTGRLEDGNAVHGDVRLERLEGRLADHRVSARGDATLLGHGLSTPGMELALDDARLTVSGDTHWAPVISWDLRVQARNLDPGMVDPQWAGRLNLQGRSDGHLDTELGVEAFIRLDRLEGTLRDLPVSARGEARIEEGRRIVTPGLQASMGENRIELEGRAQADAADLNYVIDAPALDVLWPGLRGALSGDGRITGDWQRPALDLRLRGSGLGYEAWSLEYLSLEASGALDGADPLTLSLEAADLALDAQTLASSVQLTARGREDAHEVLLDARTAEGVVGLGLQGRMTEAPGWSGEVVRLEFSETRLGDWTLDGPAALEADAARISLALLCVKRDDAALCLAGERQEVAGLVAQAELSGFLLPWLAEWLPDNVTADGVLSADVRLRHDAQGLTGQARARVDEGTLRVLTPDGEHEDIPFRDVRVDAEKSNGVIETTAGLSFLERGQATARLLLTPEGDTHRLAGSARADLEELRWLEVAAPQVRDLTGRLQANLDVSGTLETPDFRGDVRLSEGRALIPEAGIELTDMHLHGAAEGLDRLTLSGGVRSGPGALELSGEMGLTPEGAPWARMALEGDRFRAVRRPEAQVLVSPDLTMELEGRLIRLDGRLTIPEANIELRELPPQAVSVSRDEVIVDAEADDEPPWQVYSTVTVILGDQVRLSGFGLTARLAGEVAVEDSPARPTRVEGEIRVEDGRYRAYGQNLIVERGVLVFQGPADNPGLDIRAVRRVPAYNVTAGLAIGGTLQDPRSRVFSTPAMEDSEAMSFLLTGRPLSGASEADANVLATAIAAFGVEQGGMLTEQIGQAVGLDEFVLDSEGDVDQSALMMGKQLSSRLYLRYTVGLFERASSLMLRYSLTRTLSLETRTSDEAQSMDLIYRRER
ncbi:translocation/assembly module TamB domain-containing protein [Thioalkalivibrio denitrificans]|uniref:translocation/assembly module TamB domain-containing protein n=1 Tax=Thioalkalivibrio denitrificans TaxID=108003 RepID=UPI001FE8C42F|nr:translocation/assembly module TamB domain-containing protein [Thioalkalivibrio denitrificans]